MTWLLHITGGEPSIYPEFAELCARLSTRHYLSINSNLSHKSIAEFAGQVDPQRVTIINAGLHPDERARRAGEAAFLRHATLLRDNGFRLMISMVATPEVLEAAEHIVADLARHGFTPFPKLLRGSHNGKMYPAAYTPAERGKFSDLARRARDANKNLLSSIAEQPTIDIARDDDFLDGVPVFKGLDCEAGMRFVRLEGNGDMYRCSTQTSFGNLFDGLHRLRTKATPCDTNYCFYFCMKYTNAAHSAASA